ncbi:asparaginase [Lichenifustis flavocetrariae]|uniref:Asparaginase n=1 Tax=Lichenifustis flavocetrariae TaxID=2949735 RepID=A0AA42CGV8_9HYPH|nr:asparaginase [Lichenifustis flavocetrariae]MCW6506619.1 asparaginase [Lichenifustis flavocetrariae]
MVAKVAFIGTGGTMSSVGRGPLDLLDYSINKTMLHAEEILDAFPEVREVAEIVPVRFKAVPTTALGFPEWKELALICDRLVAEHPDLAGIVIGHGTATLEETAYILSLTLKVSIPVVIVGSQRPLSGLSTDAALNLVNAVRTAASPASRGRGVLVLLNDEIQAAREVTKTSTFRMQTFRTPDFGILGYVDGDLVRYYRSTERRHAPDTEFDLRPLEALPRVDIVYSYAGGDGTAIRAYVAAGARGLVSAGFAPGMTTPDEGVALAEAVKAGVTVLQSTRAGSGVTLDGHKLRDMGIIPADNLNPQKARLLLALALTVTRDPVEIRRIVDTY